MEPLFSQSLNKDRTYLLTASSQSSPESIASTLGLAKSANLSASLIARTALSASYGRSGGGDTDSMSTTSRLEKSKGVSQKSKSISVFMKSTDRRRLFLKVNTLLQSSQKVKMAKNKTLSSTDSKLWPSTGKCEVSVRLTSLS